MTVELGLRSAAERNRRYRLRHPERVREAAKQRRQRPQCERIASYEEARKRYWADPEAIRLGPAITRTYDFEFFDQFTPGSAYWAGFLAADGCVRSDRAAVSLRLAVRDSGHVEKFRQAVRYNGEVKISESAAYLHVNGPRWVAALDQNFNIRPRKSLTYTMPKLPSDVLPHFIRGIIDGDGSITRTSTPTVAIVGTRSLLSDLSEIFFDRCDVRLKSKNRVPPVVLQSNGITGIVSWSGRNAAKILRWVYADSTNAVRLDRKYAKWRELWPIESVEVQPAPHFTAEPGGFLAETIPPMPSLDPVRQLETAA